MKIFHSSVVTAALLAVLAGGASADPLPSCSSGDIYCTSVGRAIPQTGTSLDGLLPGGILAIGPKSGTSQSNLYVFFDGNPNYAFDGYLGLNAADLDKSLLGLVGDAVGNFDRNGSNAPILELLTLLDPTLINDGPLVYVLPNLVFLNDPSVGIPQIPNLSTDVLSSFVPRLLP